MENAAAEMDRRISSRLKVGYTVKCIVDGLTGPCAAELDNVSRTGVFVWMTQQLPLGTRFELLITPEEELNEEPFKMLVEVVRRVEGEVNPGRTGYGCILLETTLEEQLADAELDALDPITS